MKLTLINPPQIFSKYQVATGIVPPLGLAYLASYAIQEGIKVDLIDALGEAPQTVNYFQKDIFLRGLSFSDIIQRIDPNTNLIGISILFSFAYPAVKDFIKEIKKNGKKTCF